MRLKQIKLAGFKSFVDATLVPFPQQMTAVVGPNGCGKSNVIDAVRWVLGESSAKNLRGDAMTDVIFNGSSQRKPVSQASVELVFENTQGRLQGQLADRSEISVKRLVTRDAQSNYFLNGSKCRRRDITDIFLGTGLGPRSYAIIEQGMISRLIESKPQELRVFIEEAAGISKYKERRRETENRIKHTRENLERLADVRQELALNIDKLQRQASAAERFKQLKAQERQLKTELTAIKWLHFSQKLAELEQQMLAQQTELDKVQSEELGEQRLLLELKQQAQQQRDLLQHTQSRFYQLAGQISRLEQQILHQRQQQHSLQAQCQQALHSLAQANDFIETEQALQAQLEEQLAEDEPRLAIVSEQIAELSEQLEQAEEQQLLQQQAWQRWQQQHFNLQQQQQQQQLQQHNLLSQLAQLQQQQQQVAQELAELALAPLQQQQQQLSLQLEQSALQRDSLHQQQQQALSLFQQQQQLSRQAEAQQLTLQSELTLLQREQQQLAQLQQQQQSQQQQLLQQLTIKPGWASAVALVLGQLQHALVSEQLTLAQTQVSRNELPARPGSLAEVVITGVYPQSFNQIILAPSAQAALAQSATLNSGESVISPCGFWLGANWSLQAGALQQDNVLQRAERLLQLQQLMAQSEQVLAEQREALEHQQLAEQQAEQDYQQAQQRLVAAEQAYQQGHTALLLASQQWQQAEQRSAKLQAQQQQLQLQQAQWEERSEQLALALEQSAEQVLLHEQQQQTAQQNAAAQQLPQLRAQFEQKRTLQQQLSTQQRLSQQQLQTIAQNLQRALTQQQQLTEQLAQLQAGMAEQQQQPEELQAQLQLTLAEHSETEQQMISQQQQLLTLEQQVAELEQGQQGMLQRLARKQAELAELRLDAEGYRVRANNMLELLGEQQANMQLLLAGLAPEADEAQWQLQLDKTSAALGRLGPINLAAIEEYAQQAERKQYLDAQNADLHAALETLETAMRKIDRDTRQKFKETFEQVNAGLQQLFPKVFGGGSAYLDLTDEDLLETGVSIMARPPGKKNSTIHLLSGGEKALTALSLVFSIFRLNPAPFCMLDEVDAPLDDANVGRFCNLVREMSESVQFIYISHNKIAMEMASQLMGVTMQEPGVSRVVAVDVDDAVKLAVA